MAVQGAKDFVILAIIHSFISTLRSDCNDCIEAICAR